MKINRAWIYCSVDTPEDTHGALKSQHEKLDSYAKQMEFEVVGSSHDIEKGENKERSGFQEVIEAARSGRMDVLLVESIFRIHCNEIKIMNYFMELNDYGVALCSLEEMKFDRKKR